MTRRALGQTVAATLFVMGAGPAVKAVAEGSDAHPPTLAARDAPSRAGGAAAPDAWPSEPAPSPSTTSPSTTSPSATSPSATSPSTAVGTPSRGRLRDGVPLEPSETLAVKRGSERNRFGTAELVGLLERAAARVAALAPGGRLLVGDLSAERGGRLRPHRSHRNGLDADVGFYAVDLEGAPATLERFVAFRGDGTARGAHEGAVRFDDVRNWHLVESLLSDPLAQVQRIFVSAPLRARLLAAGERLGASDFVLARAEMILQSQGRGARGHDDHLHVRIGCPEDDQPTCAPVPLGPALEAAVEAS